MPIDKLTEWASDGTPGQVVTPAESKIELGWVPGEQPPAEYHNAILNRDNEKINELIEASNRVDESDISSDRYARCTDIADYNSIWHPASTINRKALGYIFPLGLFRDTCTICRGYDYARNLECVFGISAFTPNELHVYYNIPGTFEYTVENITLTGGPANTDIPIDICCDGYYIYIAVNDETGSYSSIYRYQLSASGTVNTVCDAYRNIGSTALFADRTDTIDGNGRYMIVADSTRLAFVDHNGGQIGIIAKTLNVDPVYGAGNQAVDGGSVQPFSICSDGTRIWFFTRPTIGGLTYDAVCCAKITDPTNVNGGWTQRIYSTAGTPIEADRNIVWSELVYDGRHIHAIGSELTATGLHGMSHSVLDINSGKYFAHRGKLAVGHRAIETFGYQRPWKACYTGRRIATIGPICPKADVSPFPTDYNPNQSGLLLQHGDFGGYATIAGVSPGSYEQTIDYETSRVIAIEPDSIVANEHLAIKRVVYADNCIWILQTYRYDPATYGSYLTRVPNISALR